MKNQRDEKGQKHGLWEEYYRNGKLWYIEHYKHGIYHGLWEYYYPNGELLYKGIYKRDKLVGLWYFSSKQKHL